MKRVQRQILLAAAFVTLAATIVVHAQGFTKAVVGDHIKKVEDGVDEFRDYLEKRGETAKNNAQ
ncbi:MAG TPA: hypothetical protein VFR05_02150, partial [Terriglobia bacterium]|nr:hypothetical protein [Terriglobia bacterium]